jgi:tRNA (cytidine56-2'-O)-methyltransferase
VQLLKPETGVLRIGHRPRRDKRVTTHTALVARALGSAYYFLAGDCDWNVVRTILRVEDDWGRGFLTVSCGLSYKDYIELWREAQGVLVNLTMYGIPLNSKLIEKLRKMGKPILVSIGAKKMPSELYRIADYNIAIGSQPHSEIAALAIFLDRLYNGTVTNKVYEKPKISVIPSEKGKRIVVYERAVHEKAPPQSRGRSGRPSGGIHSKDNQPSNTSCIQDSQEEKRKCY